MRTLLSLVLWIAVALPVGADQLRLAVTTSFQNSGLADVLLPAARSDLGIEISAIVVGTGQALRLAETGDVDAVLVHAPSLEGKFVADGHASHRREIMYNTFVLVGPAADPAGVGRAETASEAFGRIAASASLFVSRGDESGTHQREVMLWDASGASGQGAWYRSVGAGMGTALNIAAGLDAYILTDRASWLNFGNKRGLEQLFSGDRALFNQYSFLPAVRAAQPASAQLLEDWLVSERGQSLIASYRIDGESVFVPNASPN